MKIRMPVGALCALLSCGAVPAVGFAKAVWTPTPVDRIRVGGVIGERLAMTVTNNLMKLDLEKDFIAAFREKKSAKTFIGTGNVMEAFVFAAKHTGDPAVVARKRMLFDAIIAAQAPDGYIGLMKPEERIWKAWDMEDVGFIIDALAYDWFEFGEERSLAAAKRAADWTIANWAKLLKPGYDELIYPNELLMGLGHGVWTLFEATGDARYADFVAKTRGYATSDEPVRLGRDKGLRGHVCGYLDTVFTQLSMYRVRGESRLTCQLDRFLRHYLHEDGGLIDGLEGICECFTGDQNGSGFAGETCMTSYLLVTLDEAIRSKAMDVSLAGDVMERTLYNAFFAAQSRDGRQLRYYTPIRGKRPYWPTDDYCCPVNYRRAVSHLPAYVFYTKEDAVLANLYAPASATLDVGGTKVAITEETDYPTSGRVRFRIDPAAEREFAFTLRLPRWCTAPSVAVNGVAVNGAVRGSLCEICRTWKAGDVVEADFPMSVRLVRGRARQAGHFAFMRGPLVYAINADKLRFDHGEWVEGSGNDNATVEDVLVVYPETIRLATGDSSARADGTAVLATSALVPYQLGKDCGFANPVELRFTEFPDPANTLTYFRVPDPAGCAAVDDELYSGKEGAR